MERFWTCKVMEEGVVAVGSRVRTVHEDPSYYQKLQQYHKLPWSARMATYIGKVGIVTDVVECGTQVTFYSWGQADIAATGDGRSSETGRNRVVEATYIWYPRLIVPEAEVHLVDGDRAIMIRNKNMRSAAMVSVRVLDDSTETLSLRTPHSAAFIWKQSDNPDDVILPVYAGRQLNSLMRDRNLPAHLAVKSSPSRVVFGLSPPSADPTAFIDTIVQWAASGDGRPFRLALHRFPQLKNAMVNGRSALAVACDIGIWTAAAILLCAGADKRVSDPAGNRLLHLAAQNGNERVVEGLLIFDADDVNRRNMKGETALHCAVRANSVACVDRLLNTLELDPNLQDCDGNTALHVLARAEDVASRSAILHRMLSNVKVEQLVANHDGLTPLQVAVVAGQAKVVESVIGMRPSLLVSEGCEAMLPLHLAAAYGWSDVLDTVLKISGDASKTTKANRTALHFAVERWDGRADMDMQRLACIQSLVSHGVPLNVRDCNGSTALHLAVGAVSQQPTLTPSKVEELLRMRKPNIRLEEIASVIRPNWPAAVVCFLVAQGCDPRIRDCNGITPADLTMQPFFRNVFEQYASYRSRACVAMSSSVERMFDSAGVTMCTFNCEDNVADTVFVPCGHRVVCTRCVGDISIRRCPLCYQHIIAAKNSQGEEVVVGGNVIKSEESVDEAPIEEKDDRNKKVVDESEMCRIAQEAAERAKRATEEEKEEVVRELREKVEQLEMEVCCAICLDQRCTVAFQCGHTACSDCSHPSRLKLCHICRQPIKRRTTLYS